MRILVVDDERFNRVIIVEMLGAIGVEVQEAADAPRGLELFEREDFDAVLMDVRMPGMDGFEAVRRIRAMPVPKSGAPVIMVTGDVTDDCSRAAAASGADGVLYKPVSMSELYEAVASAVSGAGLAVLN